MLHFRDVSCGNNNGNTVATNEMLKHTWTESPDERVDRPPGIGFRNKLKEPFGA